MRILTLNYEYPPVGGGGGVAHKALVDEWKKHHEVVLITTRVRGQAYTEYTHGIRVYRAPCLRFSIPTADVHSLLLFLITPLFWLMWLKIRRRRFHIINAQFAIPTGVVGVCAKWIFGAPLVISIHGGDIYDPSKKVSPHRYAITRWLVSWVLQHADYIIPQSTNTLQNAQRYYRFDSRSQIIPLPLAVVDRSSVQPLPDTPAYTFIAVGRLVARKCFDDFIAAVARVHAKHPEIRACIIGRGPQEAYLRACIRKQKMERIIHIRTTVDDTFKYQLLHNASCYVLSSEHEGYGIVVQEAMFAGLPIVATNNGGQTDFLRHEYNALLCAPHDIDALSEAMQRMITHPEQASAYVARYPEALALFDPLRVAQSTIELYKKCL